MAKAVPKLKKLSAAEKAARTTPAQAKGDLSSRQGGLKKATSSVSAKKSIDFVRSVRRK